MTRKPRILLTGPRHSIERWADVAREAGWEPLVHPLVATVSVEVDLAPLLAQPIEWLVITSSSALDSLTRDPSVLERARSLRVAVVGEATAGRARALGLSLALDPAPIASQLARALLEQAEPRTLVLWPRGSLSNELARTLREGGLRVLDPIVYRTETAPTIDPLPAADAVLFASPSGVRAYAACQRPVPLPPIALALGPNTRVAIEAAGFSFEATYPLERPDALAFSRLLSRLRSEAPG